MSSSPVFPLADVAEIAAGITLGRKTKERDLVDVPYLRVANVQDGHLSLTELKTIPASRREIEKWALQDGDLLLTEGGDLDKLGRGACWRAQVPLCIHQNHIFRVRFTSDRYDPDFVSFQIGSPYGKAYFFAHAKKTTGIASINQRVLGRFPLVSPPIDEQRRIAGRLKDQLKEVQVAREAAQAQLQEISLLRRRILSEMFVFADVPRKVLGDHAVTTSGTTPRRGERKLWEPATIPWVKTGEVAFEPITKTEEAVSEFALTACALSLLPPKTVLIAMYGQGKTRGQCAILEVPATTNQACFAILPNDTWESAFLFYWLTASYHDLRKLSNDRGGNQANLNGSLLRALAVPVPPKGAQIDAVLRAQAALQDVDALARSTKRQIAELEKLPQNLLARSFKIK